MNHPIQYPISQASYRMAHAHSRETKQKTRSFATQNEEGFDLSSSSLSPSHDTYSSHPQNCRMLARAVTRGYCEKCSYRNSCEARK